MRDYIQHVEHFYIVGILLLEYLYATYIWNILLMPFNLLEGLMICSVELLNWTQFV